MVGECSVLRSSSWINCSSSLGPTKYLACINHSLIIIRTLFQKPTVESDRSACWHSTAACLVKLTWCSIERDSWKIWIRQVGESIYIHIYTLTLTTFCFRTLQITPTITSRLHSPILCITSVTSFLFLLLSCIWRVWWSRRTLLIIVIVAAYLSFS